MEFLGFDIGGTKTAVVRGNEKGEVLEKIKFPTTNVTETLKNIFDAAEKIKGDSVCVGISCGGPLDSETGTILSPPSLADWDRIEIVKMVKEKLGLEAYLCNDANACAVAEWKFGAGIGAKNMIFFTFGTGLGAGLILDGKLYNGTNGNAGEAGHIRLEHYGPAGYGKQGSFEGFCSGGGIARSAQAYATEAIQRGEKPMFCDDLSKLNTITAKSVAEAARAGDETAIKVYKKTGEMLGRGLSVIIDILNPEKIVIGSVYQRAADLLKEDMERVIKEEALSYARDVVEIVPAKLGDEIGDSAALALALDYYERKMKNA